MLVLSRKTGQQIQIGDNITITILQMKGRTVRVGIDAPAEVRVLRSELIDEPQSMSPCDTAETYRARAAGGARPHSPLRSALMALRRDLPTCLSNG